MTSKSKCGYHLFISRIFYNDFQKLGFCAKLGFFKDLYMNFCEIEIFFGQIFVKSFWNNDKNSGIEVSRR